MSAGILDWVTRPGGQPDRPHTHFGSHLEAFQILLLAHLVVQAWSWWLVPVPYPYTFSSNLVLCAAVVMTALLGLAEFGRIRLACFIAFPILFAEIAWLFPATPNHVFLSLVLIGLCCATDTKKSEDSLLLMQGLRWVVVIIFVWAGIQKVLHGLFFQGEFLSWMIAHGVDRWAAFFAWMIPDAELARIGELPRYVPGTGPYRVDSWLFVAASNSVWLGEIALGLAMIHPRTRGAAAIGAVGLVFLIQSAPREFMFALLYASLLLLLFHTNWIGKLMPLFLLVYACMLAAVLGAPLSFLMRAGGGL